jgi:hypothetical protein
MTCRAIQEGKKVAGGWSTAPPSSSDFTENSEEPK